MALTIQTNNNNPRVLVVGIQKNATNLIQQIVETSPVKFQKDETQLEEYMWKIQNKYYSADVCLTITNDPSKIIANVEAVAYYIDSEESIDRLTAINNDINENYELDTKIVIADGPSKGLTKWCLQNEFEFIDLSDSSAGDEDDFYDTTGLARIKEALQVHIWPNAQMNNVATGREDQEELELDEFCQLFSQFSAMKDSIGNLPRGQRLDCAEQVIHKFWNAINGDEDELSDTSDVNKDK